MLKDHFDQEFEVHDRITTANELKQFLIQSNPVSAALLENCRFAVNEEFVDLNYKLNTDDIITIIPPSSGG